MGGSRNFPDGLDIAFWIADFCLRDDGKSGSGGLHAVVWSWCQDSDGIFPDGVCIWKPDRTVFADRRDHGNGAGLRSGRRKASRLGPCLWAWNLQFIWYVCDDHADRSVVSGIKMGEIRQKKQMDERNMNKKKQTRKGISVIYLTMGLLLGLVIECLITVYDFSHGKWQF